MSYRESTVSLLAPEDAPNSTSGAGLSPSQQEAVREELHRLLASARFSSSPRCQALLLYVVGNALSGNGGSLKERSIGAEVFGRDPSYDTNNDPVVRMAAGEVRKKLAQYYYAPTVQSKVRIEMPVGSYAPIFSFSDVPSLPFENAVLTLEAKAETQPQLESAPPRRIEIHATRRTTRWLVMGLLAAVASGSLYWGLHSKSHDAFETFWAPVVASPNPALLCVGELRMPRPQLGPGTIPSPAPPVTTGEGGGDEINLLVTPVQDSITLVNLATLLRTEGKAFSVRGARSTSFDDLQKGPAILLGSFNNEWTMRLTSSMRFHFARDAKTLTRWIVDEQKPGVEIGADGPFNHQPNGEDYVIVVRTFAPQTKQPTLIVAGMTPVSTHAAGEFLTNPAYLNDFSKTAPPNWQTKNMELILVTKNVNGDSGPPQVVDSHFW